MSTPPSLDPSGEADRAAVKAADNTWDQVGHGGVYITYLDSRARVIRRGYLTDPGGHWRDRGHKVSFGNKREAIEAAKAWAGEHFGIVRWRANGMGDFVNADLDLPPLRRELERKAARKKPG